MKHLTPLVILLLFGPPLAGQIPGEGRSGVPFTPPALLDSSIPTYGYEIVNSYPHDDEAFTQGLIYENGTLYEGTGLYGHSTLRRVDLETGNVVKVRELSNQYFGEGITMYENRIIQLTWQNGIGFVYEENAGFDLIGSFFYSTEGWGLTHDDTCLIMSDGTSRIYYLDPDTYTQVGFIDVTAEGEPIDYLNELEYIQGKIYSNIWFSDLLAIIDPATGNVEGWVDLRDIQGSPQAGNRSNVLNGIAVDRQEVRLFVTGKLWPTLFEIEIEPLEYPPRVLSFGPSSPVSVERDSVITLWVRARDPDTEDSLTYSWRVDGVVVPSANDSSFSYSSPVPAVDTVSVEIADGMYSRSVTWLVLVETVGIASEDHSGGGSRVPKEASLYQNYPNPFNPATVISFNVPGTEESATRVAITIHDVRGKQVRDLIDSPMRRGRHTLTWDGRNDRGERVSSGVYICTLRCGDEVFTRKMTVLE